MMRFDQNGNLTQMRASLPILCIALAMGAAGCRQEEEPDAPLIGRLAGDWAPIVLENCDLRVKFGSSSIWVVRDGKTHKISSFHRVRIDGTDMDIVLNEGEASKVLSFRTGPNNLKLVSVRSPTGEDLNDSISEDADQKIKYLSMRAKTLFDLRRCVEVNDEEQK
jgi:hypothetical protein